MKKVWNPELSMEQVAELGYFIIKYIENFELILTVGVGHIGYPQNWFIPHDEREEGEREKRLTTKSHQRDGQFNFRG